jgi:hypothetical protein
MPFEMKREPDGVFVITGSGVVTAAQWLEAVKALYADSRHVEPSRVLWDFRDVSLEWTASNIAPEVDFVRKKRSPGKGRSAGVVSSDLIYGLVRMFELSVFEIRMFDLSVKSMKDLEVRVFRETEPAFDWLREDF